MEIQLEKTNSIDDSDMEIQLEKTHSIGDSDMGNQLEKPDSIADVNIMQHSDLEMYHWLRVMHVDKIIYRHIRSRTILAHLIQQGLSENSPKIHQDP